MRVWVLLSIYTTALSKSRHERGGGAAQRTIDNLLQATGLRLAIRFREELYKQYTLRWPSIHLHIFNFVFFFAALERALVLLSQILRQQGGLAQGDLDLK